MATRQTTEQVGGVTQLQVVVALGVVYAVWGSTYLFIRIAIETLPPFLMAGVRFLIAGALLYGWSRLRGGARPTGVQWRAAAIVGILLLAMGNGTVVWVEQQVPSGVAALLVGLVPAWIVLLDWVRPGGSRPALLVMGGVVLGFAGVLLLVTHGGATQGQGISPVAGFIVLSSLAWAAGSLYARRAPLPAAPLIGTAVEMLAGGAVLIVAGVLTGEPARLDTRHISLVSVLALVYLVIFGSLIAYTAYTWLLRSVRPAIASTYAYVNPVVAVLLGWAFAGEAVSGWTFLAAAVIVSAVVLITSHPHAPVASEPLAAPALPVASGETREESATPAIETH